MEKKIRKGMKVRCPFVGGDEWATVSHIWPSGRVEITYPGAGYVIEVDIKELIY
jgi:hypothetical protein